MLDKSLLLGLCSLPLIVLGGFAAPPEVSNADEQTLKAVGLDTSAAALLDFFRSKTLEDADREMIAALVRNLDADDFTVRQKASRKLVKVGSKAISLLRQAKGSLEVERRAEECLRKIEQINRPAVTVAAVRLLAARQPEATAQTLLKFAPFADDPDVLESLRDTLAAVAVRAGKPDPVLTEALGSKQPLLRGLAGEALVRAGQADAVPALRGLLNDADRLVRLRVGLALVDKNDKTVIPRLIELLADLPRAQSRAIVRVLERIARDKSPQVPPGDDGLARKQRRDAWSEWWTTNGGAIDLAKIQRRPVVVMETSQGTIEIELIPDKAPLTVKNFLQYVEDRHYDGLIFHRVCPDFIIQGGGMEPGLTERKTRAPIKNESPNSLSNQRGAIAMWMARGLVDPDSATSQFFINVKDNEGLDKANVNEKAGYCVFGKVIDGMAVVDKIQAVKTGPGAVLGYGNVPVEDVVIKSVRVVR